MPWEALINGRLGNMWADTCTLMTQLRYVVPVPRWGQGLLRGHFGGHPAELDAQVGGSDGHIWGDGELKMPSMALD